MLDRIFGIYFIIALIVSGLWLWLFWKDTTTPKTSLISWLVILIAPWFWPIVLPLSIAELNVKLAKLKKTEPHKNNLRSVKASSN
jgi:hypothetical protein